MADIIRAASIAVVLAVNSAQPRIPANLDAGAFRPVVQKMLDASPTFRRQCARVALEPRFTMTIRVDLSHKALPIRASTSISRTRADIVLMSPNDSVELIAHELEHVIEHLERVDLAARIAAGEAHRSGQGFESARAIEAGRQVAREAEFSKQQAPAARASGRTKARRQA